MNARQFYIILITFVISLKVQRMPCMMYDFVGKDSYFIYLLYLLIDLIGIIIAFYLSKKLKIITNKNLTKKNIVEFFIKIFAIIVAIYFLIQSILFYESIQDLFSHILFDNLSWKVFSLFLLSSMYFLSCFKLENIGRVCEVFFPLIIFSFIILAIFASQHTDFSEILPFQTISKINIFKTLKSFNFWFGDFFIVLFLGVYTKDIKLKFTILSYIGSMIFVAFMVLEFNGIFHIYCPMQPSLVSVISEQSLLGIDIGRIDWFLILITEFGTVIGASLCLCLARHSVSKVLPKANKNIILVFLCIIIYLIDNYYLIDFYTKKIFFLEYMSNFAIVVKILAIILMLLKTWKYSDELDIIKLNNRKNNSNKKIENKRNKKKYLKLEKNCIHNCKLFNVTRKKKIANYINIYQNLYNIQSIIDKYEIDFDFNSNLFKNNYKKIDFFNRNNLNAYTFYKNKKYNLIKNAIYLNNFKNNAYYFQKINKNNYSVYKSNSNEIHSNSNYFKKFKLKLLKFKNKSCNLKFYYNQFYNNYKNKLNHSNLFNLEKDKNWDFKYKYYHNSKYKKCLFRRWAYE